MKNRLEVLQSVPVFAGVRPESLKKLAEIAKPVKFQTGDAVIKEGEAGSNMFILVDGKVRITKNITLKPTGPDAESIEKDLILLSAENHPVFGEMSLVEEDVRTATVTAVTDVELLSIERTDFHKLATQDFESAFHVLQEIARIISSRLRKTNRDVVKLTTLLGIVLSREHGL